jgi:hypothetical protein
LASIALKIRLKPQLIHDVTIAKRATMVVAPRAERGRRATYTTMRETGGEEART